MSNGLTLPFQKRQDSTVDLFSITCTSGGGRGLFGASFGTDRFGDAGTGVFGESDVGQGVYGQSQSSEGVFGQSESGPGVRAFSRKGVAIWTSTNGDTDALYATTSSPHHAGVSANNTSNGDGTVPSGFALWAKANATAIYGEGTPAGYFKGDVLVTGDLVLVNPSSGDIAEDFDVEDEQINLEPGTVLTINDDGKLCASNRPYDTRVAGVVSGGET